MKSQAALRLRQTGKHHADDTSQKRWRRLSQRLGIDVRRKLAEAFERNCAPKHSTEENQLPYTTMDYVTGICTNHFQLTFIPALDSRYQWQPHMFVNGSETP